MALLYLNTRPGVRKERVPMKHTWVVAFLLVLAGLLPQPLRAWDNTGHEVVAGIAWDNMTAAARQKAVALLGAAPANACLRSLLPNDARPLAVRQREFFIRAATWPDRVRSGPCVQFNQEDWHFLDHYWGGMSGRTGSSAPHNRTDIAMATTN